MQAYRMGWSFRWLSSAGSTFNFDMGVSFTPEDAASGEPNYNFETPAGWGEEALGISVFHRTADGRRDDRVAVSRPYRPGPRGHTDLCRVDS